MPTYSIKAPDGNTYDITGPEGATQADVIAQVLAKYPEAGTPTKPAEGVFAGIGKGFESTVSGLRTGIGGLFGKKEAAEAAAAGAARGKDINKRYADQVSMDKVKEAYNKPGGGLLPATGELISQVPLALAEQSTNLATMAAGARLGAKAGAVGGFKGRLIGGALGAFAPSFLQQAGSNIERQAEAQQAAGKPVDINRGAAYGTAIPQAALDVAGPAAALGKRVIGAVLGKEVSGLLGKGSLEAAEKLANESLTKTLLKGTAFGALVGVPPEIIQQMLERKQAGLSLTDDEAIKEYTQTAYQTGLLAPLGAAGRVASRGGARNQLTEEQAKKDQAAWADKQQVAADKASADALAAQAEILRKTQPEYLDELQIKAKQYGDQIKAMTAAAAGKADPSDLQAVAEKQQARQALKAFRTSDEFKAFQAEYDAALPAILKQQAAAKKAAAQAAPIPSQAAPAPGAAQAAPTTQYTPEQFAEMRQQMAQSQQGLAEAMNRASTLASEGDIEGAAQAQAEATAFTQTIRDLSPRLAEEPVAPPPPPAPDMEKMKAQLARLQGGVNAKGNRKAGLYERAVRETRWDDANAHLEEIKQLQEKLGVSPMQRRLVAEQQQRAAQLAEEEQAQQQAPPPAPEATPTPAPFSPKATPTLDAGINIRGSEETPATSTAPPTRITPPPTTPEQESFFLNPEPGLFGAELPQGGVDAGVQQNSVLLTKIEQLRQRRDILPATLAQLERYTDALQQPELDSATPSPRAVKLMEDIADNVDRIAFRGEGTQLQRAPKERMAAARKQGQYDIQQATVAVRNAAADPNSPAFRQAKENLKNTQARVKTQIEQLAQEMRGERGVPVEPRPTQYTLIPPRTTEVQQTDLGEEAAPRKPAVIEGEPTEEKLAQAQKSDKRGREVVAVNVLPGEKQSAAPTERTDLAAQAEAEEGTAAEAAITSAPAYESKRPLATTTTNIKRVARTGARPGPTDLGRTGIAEQITQLSERDNRTIEMLDPVFGLQSPANKLVKDAQAAVDRLTTDVADAEKAIATAKEKLQARVDALSKLEKEGPSTKALLVQGVYRAQQKEVMGKAAEEVGKHHRALVAAQDAEYAFQQEMDRVVPALAAAQSDSKAYTALMGSSKAYGKLQDGFTQIEGMNLRKTARFSTLIKTLRSRKVDTAAAADALINEDIPNLRYTHGGTVADLLETMVRMQAAININLRVNRLKGERATLQEAISGHKAVQVEAGMDIAAAQAVVAKEVKRYGTIMDKLEDLKNAPEFVEAKGEIEKATLVVKDAEQAAKEEKARVEKAAPAIKEELKKAQSVRSDVFDAEDAMRAGETPPLQIKADALLKELQEWYKAEQEEIAKIVKSDADVEATTDTLFRYAGANVELQTRVDAVVDALEWLRANNMSNPTGDLAVAGMETAAAKAEIKRLEQRRVDVEFAFRKDALEWLRANRNKVKKDVSIFKKVSVYRENMAVIDREIARITPVADTLQNSAALKALQDTVNELRGMRTDVAKEFDTLQQNTLQQKIDKITKIQRTEVEVVERSMEAKQDEVYAQQTARIQSSVLRNMFTAQRSLEEFDVVLEKAADISDAANEKMREVFKGFGIGYGIRHSAAERTAAKNDYLAKRKAYDVIKAKSDEIRLQINELETRQFNMAAKLAKRADKVTRAEAERAKAAERTEDAQFMKLPAAARKAVIAKAAKDKAEARAAEETSAENKRTAAYTASTSTTPAAIDAMVLAIEQGKVKGPKTVAVDAQLEAFRTQIGKDISPPSLKKQRGAMVSKLSDLIDARDMPLARGEIEGAKKDTKKGDGRYILTARGKENVYGEVAIPWARAAALATRNMRLTEEIIALGEKVAVIDERLDTLKGEKAEVRGELTARQEKELTYLEDTQPIAGRRGQVMKSEVTPPGKMSTGSPESRAGETETGTRNKPFEKRIVRTPSAAEVASAAAKDTAKDTVLRRNMEQAKIERELDAARTKLANIKYTHDAAAASGNVAPAGMKIQAKRLADAQAEVARLDKALVRETSTKLTAAQIKAQDKADEDRKAGLVTGSKDAPILDDEGLVAKEYGDSPRTMLSEASQEALTDGRLLDALDDVSKNGSTAFIRENAALLRKFVLRTKVTIDPDLIIDGKEVPAGYSPKLNAVLFRPGELTEENLIHEANHAAQLYAMKAPIESLSPTQRQARADLEAIFERIKNDSDLVGEYGIEDVNEFASEVQSNSILRDKLNKIGRGKETLLGRIARAFMRLLGFKPADTLSEEASKHISALYMASRKFESAAAPKLFSRPPVYNSAFSASGATAAKLVTTQKSWVDNLRANSVGLAFETQVVDRFAGFERLSKVMPPLLGSQMMYFLRMYDQRMNFVSQSVGRGALDLTEKVRADGQTEMIIESKKGPSLASVVNILKQATSTIGSADGVSHLFTMYMAAIRADRVGYNKLNFSGRISEADLKAERAKIDADPKLREIFERARDEYNAYNEGMVRFAQKSGALSEEVADRLLKEKDYVPYYREQNGNAVLMIGSEHPIRIGSIKEQPYLKELVGGDEHIFDFLVSSVQNTNMLTDMSLRNLATKNAAHQLIALGMAKMSPYKTSGPDVVQFLENGEDKYVTVDSMHGIPADLLVTGMGGIPTQLPAIVRVMGIPATLLRKAITLSPLYMAKNLFRDTLSAPVLSGANMLPVYSALKEINGATAAVLESRGVTGGQQFIGTQDDVTKILRDITAGKPGYLNVLGKFEAASMAADALTRRAQYNSYIKQGLSEMEATLMSLESMNFNKRGASASMHYLSSMVPFFNAQIQSMNVLYKALTGKMPFNERLKIQEKMLVRGAMIAATSLAYTAMMQEDKAYKNATPAQKYGHWFVRLPGVDEPVRLPVPFEIGYLFKSLPEALYNSMANKHGGEEAIKAFNTIILNTIPGGSSMPTFEMFGVKLPAPLPIPQALKPIVEGVLGRSFFTDQPTLTRREEALLPEDQFRAKTTDLSKMVGKTLGLSPIKLDKLMTDYAGGLATAFAQVISQPFAPSGSPEQVARRLSDMRVVGGLFQPNDAAGITSTVFEKMMDIKKIEASFKDRVAKGDKAGARQLLQERGAEMVMVQAADQYIAAIGKLSQFRRAIAASDATPEEKRKKSNEITQLEIRLANAQREAVDKTTPQ